MPNYSLQVNNSFKPFTMQEMLTPFLIYKDYYDKNEEAINTLTAQANTVEAMAPKGTRAYERYKQYADNLRQQANDLSTNGMSIDLRNAINTSKGDYVKQIVPIQKAYETIMKHLDKQIKMGDSRINSYDLARGEKNIDDYLDNPELNYETIDANNLYKKSDAAFGALSQDLTNYYLAKGGGNSRITDRFKEEFYKKYGYTPEEATGFIDEMRTQIDKGVSPMDAIASNPVLGNIFRQLYSSTQVDNWDNPNASAKTANVILSAAISSIGKSDVSLVDDYERETLFKDKLDYNTWLKKNETQHPNTPPTTGKSPLIWGAPVYDQEEGDSSMKTALDNLHKAQEYFSKNPEEAKKAIEYHNTIEQWNKDKHILSYEALYEKYNIPKEYQSQGAIAGGILGAICNTMRDNNVPPGYHVKGLSKKGIDNIKSLFNSFKFIEDNTSINNFELSVDNIPISNVPVNYSSYYNNTPSTSYIPTKSVFSIKANGKPFEDVAIASGYQPAQLYINDAAKKQQKSHTQLFNYADNDGNAMYYRTSKKGKVSKEKIDSVLKQDGSIIDYFRGKHRLIAEDGTWYEMLPGAQGDVLGKYDAALKDAYNPRDKKSMEKHDAILNERAIMEHQINSNKLQGESGTTTPANLSAIEYTLPGFPDDEETYDELE